MIRLLKSVIFLLLVSKTIIPQVQEITRFPLQDTTTSQLYSSIVELDNGELLFLWIESGQLKISYSNFGIIWDRTKTIVNNLSYNLSLQDMAAYKTKSGKILVAYRAYKDKTEYYLISSTDNGLNWSQPSLLMSDSLYRYDKVWHIKFSQTNDNKLWLIYTISIQKRDRIVTIVSNDDGITWSEQKVLFTHSRYGNIVSVSDSLMFIFENNNRIFYKTSSDSGATWSTIKTIDFKNKYNNEPSVVNKSDGSLILIFRNSNSTIFGEYYWAKSFDDGNTWSQPIKFTSYCGSDTELKINTNSKKMFVSFASDRNFTEPNYSEKEISRTIWYGIIGVSKDKYTPPAIYEPSYSPEAPSSLDTLIINAKVFDDESIAHVYLKYKLNDIEQTYLEMFDDGVHNDTQPNDSIYGVMLKPMNTNDTLVYSVFAEDINGYYKERFGDSVIIGVPNAFDDYRIDINRFELPLDNKGVLGKIMTNEDPGGTFDSNSVLWSGGFFISGYDNDILWGNGVISLFRIEHYLPGKIGSNANDILNKIYVLKSSDEPFGASWQSWKYAVSLGAKFFDGDGDGVYNPVDLNGNGLWDENEDRPDLIGDITTWTIFNDGKSEDMRISFEVPPKDIEIKQTVFAYSPDTHDELDGIVFIRYNIENKNNVVYDSVYFSIVIDPDIGDYTNDLSGCDTTLNSGYVYDYGEDKEYGINSPTFLTSLLQGAPVYIPGITFIDNNNNGIYDEGTDIPLDTAYFKYGDILKEEKFPGAKNKNITSFIQLIPISPVEPALTLTQLRYHQMGLNYYRKKFDPCNWEHGNVFDVNCSKVDPYFMYSGNPLTQFGWICTHQADQTAMLNSGPFTLKPNEPVEIIAAYVVGRGNTSLESINVTKKLVKNALGFYSTNFTYVPVEVAKKTKNQFPTKFSLSQNYPNPFNPSTTIKYSIPRCTEYYSVQQTTLKIYDVLGREVATLVNKRQKPGNYEVKFNATNLVSGVYLYQLKAGSFIESKKMLLLK